jgi:hypothetical protein
MRTVEAFEPCATIPYLRLLQQRNLTVNYQRRGGCPPHSPTHDRARFIDIQALTNVQEKLFAAMDGPYPMLEVLALGYL